MNKRASKFRFQLRIPNPQSDIVGEKKEKSTNLEHFIRLPHPCWQVLQSNIYGRYRFAPQKLLFIVAQNSEGNAKEHVKPIHQKKVPHSKQRLAKKSSTHEYKFLKKVCIYLNW
jgi:hypothetical protein